MSCLWSYLYLKIMSTYRYFVKILPRFQEHLSLPLIASKFEIKCSGNKYKYDNKYVPESLDGCFIVFNMLIRANFSKWQKVNCATLLMLYTFHSVKNIFKVQSHKRHKNDNETPDQLIYTRQLISLKIILQCISKTP